MIKRITNWRDIPPRIKVGDVIFSMERIKEKLANVDRFMEIMEDVYGDNPIHTELLRLVRSIDPDASEIYRKHKTGA